MSSSQADFVNYLSSLSNSVVYYGLWIILPTCVVGNLISLFIYTRPNLNKKTNTGFLYGWLCIINIIAIAYYCLIFRGSNLFKLTIALPCGVMINFLRVTLTLVSWMQVFICLDRFIAVFFPTKTAFMSKKIVLYGIMLTLLVAIVIMNMSNLLQTPVLNAKNVTVCSQSNDAFVAAGLIFNMMRIFIPFVLMLILNLLVIWKLKNSKARVGAAQVSTSQLESKQNSRQISNKELRFMVSTLIIDFMYLFFYLPVGISFLIHTYNFFSTSLTSDPVGNAVFNLYTSFAQMLSMSHASVLFFVFLVFNRVFRAELVILLRLDKLFPSFQLGNTTVLNKSNNTKLKRSNLKSNSRI